MPLDFDLKKIQAKVNCEFRIYDTHAETTKVFKEQTSEIANSLDKPSLRGPLAAVMQELVVNGLKAIYKKIYFKQIIPAIGIQDIPYEAKLDLFRIEIESHQTKNFVQAAQRESLFVTVRINAVKEGLEMLVTNPGEPTDIEMNRIESTLENAKKLSNLSFIFGQDDDDQDEGEQDSRQEGAGLGFSLIIMAMRSLGIQLSNFNIFVKDKSTYARVVFPWRLFFKEKGESLNILDKTSYKKISLKLMENLNYYLLVFNNEGEVLKVSKNFLEDYKLSSKKKMIKEFIPEKFFDDVLKGGGNINLAGRIDNYRLSVNLSDTKVQDDMESKNKKVLFNISGFLNQDSTISTIWAPVLTDTTKTQKLSKGGITETLKLQKIIKPYLSSEILRKAHEMIKAGKESLPEERIKVSILFADIVGFTRKAEKVDPMQVVELLNIALGILVKSIDKQGGYIDKFMGDAIMAIFENPLDAIIAAVEVQLLFNELNGFREMTGQENIQLRIGVHTGKVMIGNVGTPDRRDWTPVGDVVNTASRLEKSAFTGSILISGHTYDAVKNFVQFEKKGKLKPKGKEEQIQVYFIKSVKFQRNGREVTLKIA